MLLVLMKSEQLGLFDMPVHVAGSIDKHGHVRPPHMSTRKKRLNPEANHAPVDHVMDRLERWILQHGGPDHMRSELEAMTPEQRGKLIDAMAHVGGVDHAAVMARLGMREPELGPAPAAEKDPQPDIVEHVTKRGRTLRGVIRRDLSGHEAAAIDPYTFRKDGGWFIREKHLGAATPAASAPAAADDGESKARDEARRAVERSKAQADKLRAAGQKLQDEAAADQSRDRLANTPRRARMAASAENDARHRAAIGRTMVNIADAIERGDAKYLGGITSRAAVETLDDMVRTAIRDADRHLSYADQQSRSGRAATPADIRGARLPRLDIHGNILYEIADKLSKLKGASKVSGWAYRLAERTGRDRVATLTGNDIDMARETLKRLGGDAPWHLAHFLTRADRLARIGIKSDDDLRLALTEYLIFREGRAKADPVKEAERALVGQKVGIDFFPTPKPLAARMAEIAGIKPGMTVLEPSAGNGHLADAAKAAGGDVDTVEISHQLRSVLEAKGHRIVDHNFDSFEPQKKYDAVIMNPPFSDRQDAAHIQRAFEMLKPGGKLVAIAGEGVFSGSDKKAQAFRDWLDEHGADVERLPENTFKGADLPAQTGANARMIVMQNPAEPGPKEGDTKTENGIDYVLRDGRWHRATAAIDMAETREDLADAMAEDPHGQRAKELVRKIADAEREELSQSQPQSETPPAPPAEAAAAPSAKEAPDYDQAMQQARNNHADRLQMLRDRIDDMGGKEVVSAAIQRGGAAANALVKRLADAMGMSEDEIAAELGLRRKQAKKTIVGDQVDYGAMFTPGVLKHLNDSVLAARAEGNDNARIEADRIVQDFADTLTPQQYKNFNPERAEDLLFRKLEQIEKMLGNGSAGDEDDPNSPNYRYRDTGHIAGSRKELAAQQIAVAAKSGRQVAANEIDWESIEQNPRHAKSLIVKSNLFGKVDWAALREKGMDPGAGFLIDRVYASIAPEPGEDSPQARKDYALGLQSLRERLEAATTPQQVVDILENIQEEYDGRVLTAEESDRHKQLGEQAMKLFQEERAIEKEQEPLFHASQAAQLAKYRAHDEVSKRKRRGWAVKQELLDEERRAEEISDRAYAEYAAAIERNRPILEDLRYRRRKLGTQREAIVMGAAVRNKIENPLHRAWKTMGDRFVGVLRYRRHKGSDAFANHVTAAKSGKVKDWSWAEKEGATRAPRVSKESARFQLRVADSHDRVGGRAISPQSTAELKSMFGLRDVQSGNWVLRDPVSAKFHTEQSAAAFADLADLLGADDRHVSLNGRLALAFGARGHGAKGWADGAARAHYEPVHRIINLTKMGGGGSLAHEWFHALDNMAREAEGMGASGKYDYVTENPDLLPHGDLRDAVIALRSAMLDGAHRRKQRFEYSARDYQVAKHNIDGMYVNDIGRMIKDATDLHTALRQIDQRMGADREGSTAKQKKRAKDWRQLAIAWHGGKPEGGEIIAEYGKPMSSFALEAHILDGDRAAPYYANTHEMAARAFQSWVEDRLADQGRQNDYLSSYADNKYHVDPLTGMEWKPYPEGEERARINAAFDRFVAAVANSGTLRKALALMS